MARGNAQKSNEAECGNARNGPEVGNLSVVAECCACVYIVEVVFSRLCNITIVYIDVLHGVACCLFVCLFLLVLRVFTAWFL